MADLRDTLNLFARQFALALQRSTRLPPGGAADAGERADEELLRSSTRHLPGAGWLVGLLSAFVFALVALLLRGSPGGPTLAAVGCVIATVLLTGAAQESALFRTVDALEGRLPGAGSSAGFGTIALVLAIVARVTAIAAIGSVSEAGVLALLEPQRTMEALPHLLSNEKDRQRALSLLDWAMSLKDVSPLQISFANSLVELIKGAAVTKAAEKPPGKETKEKVHVPQARPERKRKELRKH